MAEVSQETLFSRALIALMKGPVNQEDDPQTWQTVLDQRAQLSDYLRKIGLELTLDDVDGYAFLRQRDYQDDEESLPRIVPRHQLTYSVSLLLVLLRKRLLEFDETSGDSRLILSKDQIIEMVGVFTKNTSNEASIHDNIARDIERVREYGFLRRLSSTGDDYEVQRIIRSVIDAKWMSAMNDRLEEYFQIAEIDQTESAE